MQPHHRPFLFIAAFLAASLPVSAQIGEVTWKPVLNAHDAAEYHIEQSDLRFDLTVRGHRITADDSFTVPIDPNAPWTVTLDLDFFKDVSRWTFVPANGPGRVEAYNGNAFNATAKVTHAGVHPGEGVSPVAQFTYKTSLQNSGALQPKRLRHHRNSNDVFQFSVSELAFQILPPPPGQSIKSIEITKWEITMSGQHPPPDANPAIPEPSTYGLAAGALLLGLLWRRRRA